jgi:hypothetical protein
MQVALAQHPEWQGDWAMPAGIEQIEINPKTGAPAAPDDPDKRIELFINGTSPHGAEIIPESEVTPEELPTLEPGDVVPLPTVEASPSPSPRKAKNELRTNESGRLEGTITLDIDPTTGLIAVESCPVIRTRTFVLGTEPTKYCGPEYHRPGATPQATRPRLTNP